MTKKSILGINKVSNIEIIFELKNQNLSILAALFIYCGKRKEKCCTQFLISTELIFKTKMYSKKVRVKVKPTLIYHINER